MKYLNKKIFNPLVSIIIPVYNGSNYLREAIDSALAQTYENIEVVIVNDGSIDDTEKIAQSYGDKIRYFAKENGGVGSALNVALREMKGEYFSWLSHDDVYYPDKIEKQIEFIAGFENKNVVLYSDYDFIDEKSQLTRNIKLDHEMLQLKPEYALLRSSINGNTLLIPKKAFDEYGHFDEELKCTQDYAMWHRMLKTYKFVHIPLALVKYRVHPMQDTHTNQRFVTEGDPLWIAMMEDLPIKTKEQLEGSELNFYREMIIFLERTPYKKALEFSEKKVNEILSEKKADRFSVVFVSHSAGNYGAEKARISTVDMLMKKDVFIYVVLPSHGPLEQELDARSICYSIEDITKCVNVEKTGMDDVQDLILDNALKLAVILDKIKPDVIFTTTSVINEGAIAAKMLNIPHVWNIAEFGREEHGLKYMMAEAERLKFVDQFSDKIFFISQALKEYYAKKIDISKKSFVFPPIVSNNVLLENVADKKYFRSEKSFKIALVGSISAGKGQKDAVLAVRELLKNTKQDIELVMAGIVGDQNYYEQLQNIIKEEKLRDNVVFVGHLNNPSMLFAQADVALMCSVYEGFGRVTIEAMFARKPVIGANSGATPELIQDGENGLLYEPGNFMRLADKMRYFINNREKIGEYGEKGYTFAREQFDEKQLAYKLFSELYELKGKKMRRSVASEASQNILDNLRLEAKKTREQREIIRRKERIIQQNEQEIDFIKSSKFWKMREFYLKLKNKVIVWK